MQIGSAAEYVAVAGDDQGAREFLGANPGKWSISPIERALTGLSRSGAFCVMNAAAPSRV
jgi:hypothetical protein